MPLSTGATRAAVPPPLEPAGAPETHRTRRLLQVATAVLGAASAVLVVLGGSPPWQVARVLVVAALTGLAFWAMSRGGRWTCGWLAVALGVLGTGTGLGIGVVHAVKAGATTQAVAGLVSLAAGLTLLGAGSVILLRAAQGWRRWLALPVAFVVLQFVLLPLPQAFMATNVAPSTVGSATPADRGMTYRDVTFRTSDGVRLSGWYVPSRNGAAVLLLHGSSSTRSSLLGHAVVLARHGYGALLLDTRGHGRSGGDAMDFGWYGALDVPAAVSFLRSQPGVDPGRVAVLGLSMGGEQALTAAAADPRIRAVVAEGVEQQGPADTARLPHDVSGWIERANAWTTYGLADLLSGAHRPIALRNAVAATAPRPVLLIAGMGEVSGARYYRDGAPASTALWALPDTPHTRALVTHPAQWEARVISFLDRALTP